MEHDERVTPALEIEKAKEALETDVADAVAAYERDDDDAEALEVSIDFEEDRPADPEPDAALRAKIRAAVDAFHERPIITTSNVRVQRLTAIDSDADGEVAVSVDYAYPAT